ncbi:hypothetical protein AGABI1DRAFT_110256 [Agaricus bisporus var. burnettii JB137-S8]|uniref:1,3-beta-glucanosyltransferase n=1 Tax=Agaricus bisporus var. burnettii (strain JB137-S8 / ATCC MYA-4627 / FGSC 10392) TaxID=597362 RepID=K5Y660_AGABU|nr:uncharacterized protein AGABI1DRAFT_110256 [Agaricus bisporus var. burnettii JB137-S8]EKM83610.1 hypothetical protein AGABI1DRAFT_110256 [Agaricus bisporus var. burnettii JB137-S8]
MPPLRAARLLTALALFSCGAQAISQVTRNGRYLYNADGSRFYIKGIAYQPQGFVIASDDNAFGEPTGFEDPLAQPDACKRDIPFLQELSVNVIRAYSVNSSLNHDECMSALSNAGIYTIIDLSLPMNGSVDRSAPSWSGNLLDQYLETIDVFSKYDNVLAYNVGNEAITSNTTSVAPFIKAAARDVKAYLNSKSLSTLVAYAQIDGAENFRENVADYLSCDPTGQNSPSTAIDLFGLNNYEWCGDSTFEGSYAGLTSQFADYNVVAYFSECGCVSQPPRLWTEMDAIFSSQMSDVWSGSIAFSYFPAESVDGQYGMVTISSDGSTVQTSEDFDRLKQHYTAVSPPNSPSKDSAGASSYPSCPSSSDTFAASSTLPPTPDFAACSCLENALSCQFRPATSNYSAIVGELLDESCSLLGQSGGNCDELGANGQTGTYGRVSSCDPTIKLSYAMTSYYELNNRDAQACSFAGNGTVNSGSPASSASAAASSCITNAAAVFTPTLPAGGSNPGGSSGNGNGNGNGGGSSGNGDDTESNSALVDAKPLLGVAAMIITSVVGGILTVV